MTKPVWVTTSGFLTTASELSFFSTTVEATGTNIIYSLISGDLPPGLAFSNGEIRGIPDTVNNTTRSSFVIRASNNDGVSDRLFFIDIDGADPPNWITPSGFLSAGYYNEIYLFDSQYVNFQLSALPTQASASELTYFVSDEQGKLPNGLQLSPEGLISGFIDENVQPGSLPKRFNFNVIVTDGIGSSSRNFQLTVFNPDYFRIDSGNYTVTQALIISTSTVNLIQAGTDVFQLGAELPPSFDLSLVNPYDIVTTTVSPGLTQSSRIIDITEDSFITDRLTQDQVEVGTTLTIQRPNIGYDPTTGIPVTASNSYLLPPQFIKGTDLGIRRANNNTHLDVRAYIPTEFRSTVTYSLITGTTISTQLPEGLIFDPSGYIYGFIPYQPAYITNYSLTVKATKIDNLIGIQTSATNTFTLAIKGEIESSIEWVSTSSLGTIIAGEISELSVLAKQLSSDYSVKYQITAGSLPPGLDLARDGSISGRVQYGNTGTYTFQVLASDVYELSEIERQFTLTVIEKDSKQYTQIYTKPFLSLQKRKQYQDFILNTFTFDPKLMYRYFDPNFGVQTEIKVTLDFGLEEINLVNYIPALRKNFYKRRFQFGDIKKAVAKDDRGNILYEVVYVDIIDNMINNQGISAEDVIYVNNEIYYPSSINNMQNQLRSIVLEDNTYIGIDDYLLPKFMRTFQPGQFQLPRYITVFPICYALPGQGSKIISRIRLSGFDFKNIDLEIDRIIVAKPKDYDSDKYLIKPRQNIAEFIETDQYLFGEDWAPVPELTVRLDDENDQPLNRVEL